MAITELSLVPWRVSDAVITDSMSPSERYGHWANELGVSATASLVTLDGNDVAIPFDLDFPLFSGSNPKAFLSSEGGLGLYQDPPGDTASTAYSLSSYNINRMYGLGTRPNLLLTFHPQYDLKFQAAKLQKRFGVTIFYVELPLYASPYTLRITVAGRLQPGRMEFSSRTGSYPTNWILTELNPATGAVVQSTLLYNQPGSGNRFFTLELSNNHGLLRQVDPFAAAALLGEVPASGLLRGPSLDVPRLVGELPVCGRLLTPALAAPRLRGISYWPVRVSHAASMDQLPAIRGNHGAEWSDKLKSQLTAHWGLRVEAALASPWSIHFRYPGHQLAWGDLAVARASHALPWGNVQAPRADHTATWGVAVFPGSTLAVPWEDRASSLVAHHDLWGDGTAPRMAHTLAWGNRPLTLKAMTCSWGDGVFPQAAHEAAWSSSATPHRDHAAHWASLTLLRPTHAGPWSNAWGVRADVDLAWSDVVPLVPTPLVAGWSDLPAVRGNLAGAWADSTVLGPDHRLVWSERPVARLTHVAVYADRPAITRPNLAGWDDAIASRQSHFAKYTDRPSVQALHQAAWVEAIASRLTHAAEYGDRPSAQEVHLATWVEAITSRQSHSAEYTDSPSAQAAHQSAWVEAIASRLSHAAAYADRQASEGEHQAGWGEGDAPRFAHAAIYADRPANEATHQVGWENASVVRPTHAALYADRLAGARSHQAGWGEADAPRLAHATVYADRPASEATHQVGWGGRSGVTQTHAGGWALTTMGRRGHSLKWSLLARPQAQAAHRAGWLLLEDLQLVSIENVPELQWQGRSLAVEAASLSMDEDSPVWIAEEIVIADLDAWGSIALGDELTLSIHQESWRLRVDGKGMKRPGLGALSLSLSAVSPLAWLDAPYAAQITLDNTGVAVSAQATVADLLASVGVLRWELDDWLIPPGALALSATTPLAAARTLVTAIGGLLESDPDGTPVARKRHPVSVPDYATTPPRQVILEADLFAYTVSAVPEAGCNRLVVTNDDLSGDAARDRLEYLDEDENPYDGEMRAWPNPWRPVVLGHTGHPETVIEPLGERSHRHTELVEFIGGQGKVKYPVQDQVSLNWQHTDLGDVTVQGSDLTAATPGQSLAWVTYTSRSLDWRVSLNRDEAVQFVLI